MELNNINVCRGMIFARSISSLFILLFFLFLFSAIRKIFQPNAFDLKSSSILLDEADHSACFSFPIKRSQPKQKKKEYK
jgi:hypothetical protein